MAASLFFPNGFKIKSFNGKTAGKKSTVTITVETSNLWDFGYFLRSVAETQQHLLRPDTDEEDTNGEEESSLLASPLLKLPAPADHENKGDV